MEIPPRFKTGPTIGLIIYSRVFIRDLNAFDRTERVNFSTLNFWEPCVVFFRVADVINPIEGTKALFAIQSVLFATIYTIFIHPFSL